MAKKKKSSKKVTLKVVQLAHGEGLPLPAYQSKEAAGLDLIAAVPENNPVKLKPGARALVPTGLCFELARGFEAQVRPRSGLALKSGVTVLNTPGTIDSDYRGEVQVILINLGDAAFTVRRGERIAQLVVAPVLQAKIKSSKKLAQSKRGSGGFGSTGSTTSKTKNAKKKSAKSKSQPKEKAKTKPQSKSKPKQKSSSTKAVRKPAKTAPRIAAKSKSRTPVKRKTASEAKAKSVRQSNGRRGASTAKSRTRSKSVKK